MSRILIRSIAFLLIIFAVPIQASAAKVVLRDPPELQLHGADGLSEATVRRIILDALDRSSLPSRLWTIESEEPGLIVAKHTTAIREAVLPLLKRPLPARLRKQM